MTLFSEAIIHNNKKIENQVNRLVFNKFGKKSFWKYSGISTTLYYLVKSKIFIKL